MSNEPKPLAGLGLASEAALGNQLWKLHQEWLHGNDSNNGDEQLQSEAKLGRQINYLMLRWMDQELSHKPVPARAPAEGAVAMTSVRETRLMNPTKCLPPADDWTGG